MTAWKGLLHEKCLLLLDFSLGSSCILISSTKLSLNSETTPKGLNSLVLLHVEDIPKQVGVEVTFGVICMRVCTIFY